MDIREFCAMVSKLDMNFEGHWFRGIDKNAKLANQLLAKTQREKNAVLVGCWSIMILGLLSSVFDSATTFHYISSFLGFGGFCLFFVALGIAIRLACVRRDKIAGLKVGELTLYEVLTKLRCCLSRSANRSRR